MYQFNIVFVPEFKLKQKRQAIVERMKAMDIFPPGCLTSYDGDSKIITSVPLGFDTTHKFSVMLGQKEVQVNLLKQKELEINEEFYHYLNGDVPPTNDYNDILNCLNIIFADIPTELLRTPRSFFIDQNTRDIGKGLSLYHGFKASVKPGRKGLVLNVDTAVGIFYTHGPLIDFVCQLLRTQPGRMRERFRMNGDSLETDKYVYSALKG